MKFKTLLVGILGTVLSWIGIQGVLKVSSDYISSEEQKTNSKKQAQDEEQKIALEKQAQADLNSAISLDAEAASLIKQAVKEFDANAWKQMIEKWDQSSQILSRIPKNSLTYPQSQKALIVVNSSLSYAKQKLALEEKAQADLSLAISLDAEAAKLTKQAVENSDANVWKQMIEKWSKSSQILSEIPKSSFAYVQAQKGLIVVNTSLSSARKTLKNEEESVLLFQKSLDIANSVFKGFNTYKRYTIAELFSMKKQVQQGLNALSGIYKSSTIASVSLELVDYHNQNIDRIDAAISQIQKCMKDKSTAIQSEDYCNIGVDFDIPNPPFSLTPDSSSLADSSDTDSDPVYRFSSNGVGVYRSGSVNVSSYTRKDGTRVNSYTRSTSGPKVSGFSSSRGRSASG